MAFLCRMAHGFVAIEPLIVAKWLVGRVKLSPIWNCMTGRLNLKDMSLADELRLRETWS